MIPWREGVALIVIAGALVSGFFWIGPCNGAGSCTPVTAPSQTGYYPVGCRTKALVSTTVSGTRSSERWRIKGTRSFHWNWLVEFETKVVENDGRVLELERTFTKVREQLLLNKPTFRPDFPKHWLLDWAGKIVWERLPPEARWILKILHELDPTGEKLTTKTVEIAKRFGVKVEPAVLEIIPGTRKAFSELEGRTVRLTYVEGDGIIDH